jgi:hypothetical protein
MITQDNLKDYFTYKDGNLFWKRQPSRRITVGSIAGNLTERGYIQVKVFNKRFYAHRIIFFMFNGYFPQELDHIDGNKSNNRIENLRDSTKSQNNMNSKKRKDNTSGTKGITWDKRCNKWKVQGQANNIKYYLGRYDDMELAKKVIYEFRKQHHNEYARFE